MIIKISTIIKNFLHMYSLNTSANFHIFISFYKNLQLPSLVAVVSCDKFHQTLAMKSIFLYYTNIAKKPLEFLSYFSSHLPASASSQIKKMLITSLSIISRYSASYIIHLPKILFQILQFFDFKYICCNYIYCILWERFYFFSVFIRYCLKLFNQLLYENF